MTEAALDSDYEIEPCEQWKYSESSDRTFLSPNGSSDVSFIGKRNSDNAISQFMHNSDHSDSWFQDITGCKLVNQIASGIYGKVYHVEMVFMNQNNDAALKLFTPQNSEYYLLSCQVEMIVLEVIAAGEKMFPDEKQLSIAHLRDDVAIIECPKMLLEYIPGIDLSRMIAGEYSLQELVHLLKSMIVQITNNVLNGLHDMNIYHNDIKPQNIIFDRLSGKFYLIDWGSAILLNHMNHSIMEYSNFFGTIGYMSSFAFMIQQRSAYLNDDNETEYLIKNDYTNQYLAKRADLYSLAITAITILAEQCSVSSDSLCILTRRIKQITNTFNRKEQLTYAFWEIDKIKQLLEPVWNATQQIIQRYNSTYPDDYPELLQFLSAMLIP